MAAINLGNFVPPLDTGIMSLILPTISLSLRAPIAVVLWVPLTSLLVEAAFMPTFGKFSDSRGRKKFFIFGLGLFAAGSFLAGNSLTIFELLIYRTLQSLGATFILANGRALIADTFEPGERGFAFGTHVSTIYLGMTVGTSIAGTLLTVTQLIGWRYVFYVSGAIALIALPLSMVFLKDTTKKTSAKMDWLGGILLASWLGSALVYISEGPQTGFGSIDIFIQEIRVPVLNIYFYPNVLLSVPLLAVAILGVATLALFLLRETTFSNPVIDLRLFRTNSIFSSTNFAAFFVYVAHWSTLIVLSFYLQLRLFSPFTSALVLTVEPLAVALFANMGGWLASRGGGRNVSAFGIAVMTAALVLLATLSQNSSLEFLILILFVIGAGVGVFFPNNTNDNLSSVAPEYRSTANGILGTMRHTGQSLSLAISSILIGYSALGACLSAGCTFSPEQYLNVLHLNFLVGASFGIIAIIISLRIRKSR